jgi:hypothetical protein
MNERRRSLNRWLIALAATALLAGLGLSAWLVGRSEIESYPTLIADAYREEQHHLRVPGSQEIRLTRTGAYGIYYESSLVSSIQPPDGELPPPIECTLASTATGTVIRAVPDYVETNRYWSQERGGLGVLIMSVTVDRPGTYTFACDYRDGRSEPAIDVALGPNYFWQFLHLTARIALPLLGAIAVCAGSLLLGFTLIIVVVIRRLGIKRTTVE